MRNCSVYEQLKDGIVRHFSISKSGNIHHLYREWFVNGNLRQLKTDAYYDDGVCRFLKQWDANGKVVVNYFWADEETEEIHFHACDDERIQKIEQRKERVDNPLFDKVIKRTAKELFIHK